MTALFFITAFFAIFYATTLAFKLLKSEKFSLPDIFLLLCNSFIYYGVGYVILRDHVVGSKLLGLFTLVNALWHLSVGLIIYKKRQADRSLFYFVVGLVLVFVTMAVPVQLDSNWVTLLWVALAVLVFMIGRKRGEFFYEKLSYPLVLLAFLSLVQDWESAYGNYLVEDSSRRLMPVINIHFFTSLFTSAAFGFVTYQLFYKNSRPEREPSSYLYQFMPYGVAIIFLATLYFGIRMEVANYWNQLYMDSTIQLPEGENTTYRFRDYVRNNDLLSFRSIWIIMYSMVFISILAILNRKKIKNLNLKKLNLGLLLAVLLVFLSVGLFELSVLRDSYLHDETDVYYSSGLYNLIIRYSAMFFASVVIWLISNYRNEILFDYKLKKPIHLTLITAVLWVASSELIHWMDIAGSTQSYKFGLSLLWGVYAVLLVVMGIWKRLKHIRIAAMVLFGITLVKLFVYDLTNYDTVSKTIVFVSLGVLLLLISFLYNKYKNIIHDEA
jgi:hypothetical protein